MQKFLCTYIGAQVALTHINCSCVLFFQSHFNFILISFKQYTYNISTTKKEHEWRRCCCSGFFFFCTLLRACAHYGICYEMCKQHTQNDETHLLDFRESGITIGLQWYEHTIGHQASELDDLRGGLGPEVVGVCTRYVHHRDDCLFSFVLFHNNIKKKKNIQLCVSV